MLFNSRMFAGAGQKFSMSGIKKTVLRRALIQKRTQWMVTVESKSQIPDIFGDLETLAGRIF